METRSSILAWRIPWTEEPGRPTEHVYRTSLVAQRLRTACQYRGHGFDPWSRKTPYATRQLSPCATTTEPMHSRACALQQEKPLWWEACALTLLSATNWENLCVAMKTQHSPKQTNKNYERTPTNPCQITFLKNTHMGDLTMATSRQTWKMAGSLGRQPWIWEGPKTKVLWNFMTRNQAALTIKQVVEISWSEVKVAQLCLILCDPMEHSPPDSSVYGILQARILEWAAMAFFRDLPNPGIKSRSPALQADSLLFELLGKPYQTPSPASNKMLQTQLEVSESLPCSGYHHLDSGCLQFPCMFLSFY